MPFFVVLVRLRRGVRLNERHNLSATTSLWKGTLQSHMPDSYSPLERLSITRMSETLIAQLTEN
jgi:hypothetical protein